MEWEVRIHNVVASLDIENRIPLVRIANTLEGVEYEPDQFPGLVLRIDEPKSAALIFSNGKVISTGTKSVQQANESINKLLEIFSELSIPYNNTNHNIDNVVASTYVEGGLDLTKIAWELEDTEYEPRNFPGLIYRQHETGVVFLLFSTGKIVGTGAKSEEQIRKAFELLYKKLKEINVI